MSRAISLSIAYLLAVAASFSLGYSASEAGWFRPSATPEAALTSSKDAIVPLEGLLKFDKIDEIHFSEEDASSYVAYDGAKDEVYGLLDGKSFRMTTHPKKDESDPAEGLPFECCACSGFSWSWDSDTGTLLLTDPEGDMQRWSPGVSNVDVVLYEPEVGVRFVW